MVWCVSTQDVEGCVWTDNHPPVGWILALPALGSSEYEGCQMVTFFKQLCRSDQCVVTDSCGLPRPGVFCLASASNIHLWVMSTAAHYEQLSVDVEGESAGVQQIT